jgi:hypothetical protein
MPRRLLVVTAEVADDVLNDFVRSRAGADAAERHGETTLDESSFLHEFAPLARAAENSPGTTAP